jgi:isoleucyl-tRNA synthetase
MQSLWWAFGELYKKGLIYKSKKVMPYSPQCETPLSNFEATSNYMEKTDLSVYIKFHTIGSSASLLVYTTTPWSLFANQGICVNPDLDYVLICDKEYSDQMWLELSCYEKLFKPEEYRIIKTVKGIDLVGTTYYPIFPLSGHPEYEKMKAILP